MVETGAEASRFKCCDEVFYAGSITRPGRYAEFHLVDERIVGRKPSTLDWAETAVLPLTAITTWEALFDRLDVKGRVVPGAAPAILIIGGAGGRGPTPFALIDDPPSLDTAPFKRKSVSVHWEFMFTRSMFGAWMLARSARRWPSISGGSTPLTSSAPMR